MLTRVSAVKQYEACPRSWWFRYVRQVSEPGVVYGIVFGNVLHAVLERWLNEDARVFPVGWQWCAESKQRINHEDEPLLKNMVRHAISEGYLRRHPERLVEKNWQVVLDPGKRFLLDEPLVAHGTIDLAEPRHVIDHKNVKSMQYAVPKALLRTNLQLLVYGFVHARLFDLGLKTDDSVELSHIIYDRSSGRTKMRTVEVSYGDCVNGFQRFENQSRLMLPLSHEKDWEKVPGAINDPTRGVSYCDTAMYGTCGYLPICSRRESLDAFESRCLRLRLPGEAKTDFQKEYQRMADKALGGKAKKVAPPADDEDEDEEPAPAKKRARSLFEDEDEEDEEPAPPPKKVKKAPPPVEEDEDEEDEDEEDEEPAPPPKKAKKAPPPVEEDEDEEDEEPAPPPKKVKKAELPSAEERKAKSTPQREMLRALDAQFAQEDARTLRQRLVKILASALLNDSDK